MTARMVDRKLSKRDRALLRLRERVADAVVEDAWLGHPPGYLDECIAEAKERAARELAA